MYIHFCGWTYCNYTHALPFQTGRIIIYGQAGFIKADFYVTQFKSCDLDCYDYIIMLIVFKFVIRYSQPCEKVGKIENVGPCIDQGCDMVEISMCIV